MIGKKPLPIPDNVTVEIKSQKEGSKVLVSGPKGKLEVDVLEGIGLKVKGEEINFDKSPQVPQAIFGLSYSLVRNAVEGVSEGYVVELELVGVGYRAFKSAEGLTLNLGFSHPVEFEIPEGVEVEVGDNTKIHLSGADKQLVSQTAAKIRNLRPPEPYKGKGIRYKDEVVRRKPGKAAKAAAGLGA